MRVLVGHVRRLLESSNLPRGLHSDKVRGASVRVYYHCRPTAPRGEWQVRSVAKQKKERKKKKERRRPRPTTSYDRIEKIEGRRGKSRGASGTHGTLGG